MTARFHSRTIAVLACLPAVLLLSACAMTSRPVDFYTLSPVTASGAALEKPVPACRDVVIGVGAVAWPSYIDRPQIVTRLSPSRVSFDEFHRWASPPDDDFRRVLIENLSRLLHTDYVIKYPGPLLYTPRYRVQVHVEQFDGHPGEAVTLKAAWSVFDPHGGKQAALHEAVIREPIGGQGYEAMVVAASAAVVDLSRRIAAEISGRCAAPPGK